MLHDRERVEDGGLLLAVLDSFALFNEGRNDHGKESGKEDKNDNAFGNQLPFRFLHVGSL